MITRRNLLGIATAAPILAAIPANADTDIGEINLDFAGERYIEFDVHGDYETVRSILGKGSCAGTIYGRDGIKVEKPTSYTCGHYADGVFYAMVGYRMVLKCTSSTAKLAIVRDENTFVEAIRDLGETIDWAEYYDDVRSRGMTFVTPRRDYYIKQVYMNWCQPTPRHQHCYQNGS